MRNHHQRLRAFDGELHRFLQIFRIERGEAFVEEELFQIVIRGRIPAQAEEVFFAFVRKRIKLSVTTFPKL